MNGLKVDPEAMEPVVLDIPLPRKGKRTELTATLVDDLSKHVFANLPVTMIFTVADAGGNEGSSAPYEVTLHGKRFFDPLAVDEGAVGAVLVDEPKSPGDVVGERGMHAAQAQVGEDQVILPGATDLTRKPGDQELLASAVRAGRFESPLIFQETAPPV